MKKLTFSLGSGLPQIGPKVATSRLGSDLPLNRSFGYGISGFCSQSKSHGDDSMESAPSVNNYNVDERMSASDTSSRPSSTTPPSNRDSVNPPDPDDQVMELHGLIREKTDEIIKKAGHDNLFPQEEDKIALAERLHGESDNIDFLKSILTDLEKNGHNATEYKEALKLFDFNLSLCPLDQLPYNNLALYPMLFTISIIAIAVLLFWSKTRKKK